MWSGQLVDGYAVILFNRGLAEQQISFNFTTVGFQQSKANIRDLINHQNLGTFSNTFAAKVQPRSVMVLKLTSATEEEQQIQ